MVQIIMNPDKFFTPDGVTLTHVKEFCIQQTQGGICATHYKQDIPFCVSIIVTLLRYNVVSPIMCTYIFMIYWGYITGVIFVRNCIALSHVHTHTYTQYAQHAQRQVDTDRCRQAGRQTHTRTHIHTHTHTHTRTRTHTHTRTQMNSHGHIIELLTLLIFFLHRVKVFHYQIFILV